MFQSVMSPRQIGHTTTSPVPCGADANGADRNGGAGGGAGGSARNCGTGTGADGASGGTAAEAATSLTPAAGAAKAGGDFRSHHSLARFVCSPVRFGCAAGSRALRRLILPARSAAISMPRWVTSWRRASEVSANRPARNDASRRNPGSGCAAEAPGQKETNVPASVSGARDLDAELRNESGCGSLMISRMRSSPHRAASASAGSCHGMFTTRSRVSTCASSGVRTWAASAERASAAIGWFPGLDAGAVNRTTGLLPRAAGSRAGSSSTWVAGNWPGSPTYARAYPRDCGWPESRDHWMAARLVPKSRKPRPPARPTRRNGVRRCCQVRAFAGLSDVFTCVKTPALPCCARKLIWSTITFAPVCA